MPAPSTPDKPPLDGARRILNELGDPTDDCTKPGLQGVLSSHLYVMIQLGVCIAIYIIASWIRTLVVSSGIQDCMKSVRSNLVSSSPLVSKDAEGGISCFPSDGLAVAQIKTFYRSHGLAVFYLFLHLGSVAFWFALFAFNNQCAGRITTSGLLFDSSSPDKQASASLGSLHMSGDFICAYNVTSMSNIRINTVQCHYSTILPSNKALTGDSATESDLHNVAVKITESNAALCLILGVLGLMHILQFFIFAPKSKWYCVEPVLQKAGIDTSSGPPFGVTDLCLACSLGE